MEMLWKLAQMLAKEECNEEFGGDNWDALDKYDREDRVHSMYEKVCKDTDGLRTKNLKMIEGVWHMRDPKTGRFVSTKNTTEYGKVTNNTTNNVKENDTMMNRKMTNAEERTMKLAQAGVNVDNFFNLNLQIPFGAEVRLIVDGKEMVVPAQTFTHTTPIATTTCGYVGNYNGRKVNLINGDLVDSETSEVVVMNYDPIAQSIIEDGYVKNSRLFRRWVMAQTFRMLEYTDRKNPNRKGWEACMKDCYSYGYQFEMLKDELHTLAKLQKEDPEYFAERTKFFNGDVVVATLNDYLYRLKKYCKKQMRENPRHYRNQPYCKLARYGNVLVKDLDVKVYIPMQERINVIKSMVAAGEYNLIEREFNIFMDKFYNKLPYETPKCAAWKDAFKGSGAYYSLQNMCRWHGVVLRGAVGKYDSEGCLKELLNGEFKNEVWRFHNLLIDTIEYNKFDLRKSIAKGHSAPFTVSSLANSYRR